MKKNDIKYFISNIMLLKICSIILLFLILTIISITVNYPTQIESYGSTNNNKSEIYQNKEYVEQPVDSNTQLQNDKFVKSNSYTDYLYSNDYGYTPPDNFKLDIKPSELHHGYEDMIPSQIFASLYGIDPSKYYDIFKKPHLVPEHPFILGYNYYEYSDYISPQVTDFSLVKDTTQGLEYNTFSANDTAPYNYAFNNTPALITFIPYTIDKSNK